MLQVDARVEDHELEELEAVDRLAHELLERLAAVELVADRGRGGRPRSGSRARRSRRARPTRGGWRCRRTRAAIGSPRCSRWSPGSLRPCGHPRWTGRRWDDRARTAYAPLRHDRRPFAPRGTPGRRSRRAGDRAGARCVRLECQLRAAWSTSWLPNTRSSPTTDGGGHDRATRRPADDARRPRVATCCRRSGERPATVVGHSYGGAVAMLAAVRRPDLVTALGLFEPSMQWAPWWPSMETITEQAPGEQEHFRAGLEARPRPTPEERARDRALLEHELTLVAATAVRLRRGGGAARSSGAVVSPRRGASRSPTALTDELGVRAGGDRRRRATPRTARSRRRSPTSPASGRARRAAH